MIEAGKLDRVAVFERQVETVTSSGAVRRDWEAVLTMRAGIRELNAEEVAQGFGEAERETVAIALRWHPVQIGTGDRVTIAGRAYDVRRIVNLGRRKGCNLIGVAQ